VCIGMPGRVVSVGVEHPDLAHVELGGLVRNVNLGLLAEPVAPGDWVLVHMGFALSTMSEGLATETIAALEHGYGSEMSS
jgi:hydrogenase expression/formation protein HypC